ncbi:MAG: hypothetical protein KGQ48_07670 [Bradyrhizobium sp.]|uniref:hypothetical protein n=1 Tax=Bradyrhizobium sp. TaxID=376 RepID=UPI001EB0DCB6|nr:hypothetical protein [Bradyrhizobium sp.]MBU6457402.1 hypothetical protein [Bradyrhizobium sp.]MDE2603742.1 hypothetical protein [Bradyrhizobium sp.]
MQLITRTLPAAIVVLAVAAAPALARTSEAAKSGIEMAPTPCHAYEQNPDGSWKELSCAENGPAPAPARISSRTEGKTSR